MKNYYEVDNMVVNRKEGYILMKESKEKVNVSKEEMDVLLHSEWNERKQQKKYISYYAKNEDGIEYIDLFAAPPEYEPEVAYSENRLRSILVTAIEKLPARTREIGQLHFFGGLTEKEIAKKLGITHQAIHYQKKIFAKKLKENKELVTWYEEEYER